MDPTTILAGADFGTMGAVMPIVGAVALALAAVLGISAALSAGGVGISVGGRIRRGWPKLARDLGLVKQSKARGRSAPGAVQTPKIVKIERKGEITAITFTTVPGIGYDEFCSAATDLADAWKAYTVMVSQPQAGRVLVRAFTRDPLADVLASPLVGSDGALRVEPGALSCHDDIFLGRSQFGIDMVLNLARSVHGAVTGKSRSGKSITLGTILAYASLMADVRVVIIDPNTATVAPWWRTAYRASDTSDPTEAAEILNEIRAELEQRKAIFWAQRTDKISEFSPEVPLYLIVIDELANYTLHSDRDGAKEFNAALTALMSQAAKFGGRVVLAGQKLSAKAIPTEARTNVDWVVCHRVSSSEDFHHLMPDAASLGGLTAVDPKMPQGVAIASLPPLLPEPVRMRSPYLAPAMCWAISDAIVASGGGLRTEPGARPTMTKATRKPKLTIVDNSGDNSGDDDAEEQPAPEKPKRRNVGPVPPPLPDLSKNRTEEPTGTDE